jgi:hypothetical protein
MQGGCRAYGHKRVACPSLRGRRRRRGVGVCETFVQRPGGRRVSFRGMCACASVRVRGYMIIAGTVLDS